MPVGAFSLKLFIKCENSPSVHQMLAVRSQILLKDPLSNESLKFCYLHLVYVEAFRNWLS